MNDYVRKPYRTNLDGTNGLYLEEEKKEKESEEKEEKMGEEKNEVKDKETK